jgi:peroxiredoxin
VVEFVAAYCQPCQRTLPVAESRHRQGAALVIGVSEDDDPGAAWAQIRRHRLTFPVIHDGGRMVAGRFRVSQMPVSFVVDRQGKLAELHIGYKDGFVGQALMRALRERVPAPAPAPATAPAPVPPPAADPAKPSQP